MMYDYPTINFMSFYPKITAIVSYDYLISDRLPFMRTIKYLVQITVESESFFSDSSVQTQVFESFFESRYGD